MDPIALVTKGGGLDEAAADALYLRLDAANSPVTGPVTFNQDITLATAKSLLGSISSNVGSLAVPFATLFADAWQNATRFVDITDIATAAGNDLKIAAFDDVAGTNLVSSPLTLSGHTEPGLATLLTLALDLDFALATDLIAGIENQNLIDAATATTKGDILAATAAATLARLGVGSNGQVLTAASGELTGMIWAAAGGGAEVNDLTLAVTWANIPDANVPESAVSQYLGDYTKKTVAETIVEPWLFTDTALGAAINDAVGIRLQNTTAAAAGAQQAAPPLVFEGYGWKSGGPGGTASRKMEALIHFLPVEESGGSTAVPGANFSLWHSRNDGTYIEQLRSWARNNSGTGSVDYGLITSGDGTFVASKYSLSIQSNTVATYMEILNGGGTNKGAFFGIAGSGADGDAFELWNYQGGDIEFYTETTATNGLLRFTIQGDGTILVAGTLEVDGDLDHDGSGVGFYGTAPVVKPTVTGSRSGNAALASLLTALAGQGLLVDSSG